MAQHNHLSEYYREALSALMAGQKSGVQICALLGLPYGMSNLDRLTAGRSRKATVERVEATLAALLRDHPEAFAWRGKPT